MRAWSEQRRTARRRDTAWLWAAGPRIAACAAAMSLLLAAGCGVTLGGYVKPDKCKTRWGADHNTLAEAPRWVPGSAESQRVGSASCKSHHATGDLDRICAVGHAKGDGSRNATQSAARGQAVMDLEGKVAKAIEIILAGTPPGGSIANIQALADEIVYATGHIRESWEAPNCDRYVLAEVEYEAFMLVVRPAVSAAALSKMEADGEAVFRQD